MKPCLSEGDVVETRWGDHNGGASNPYLPKHVMTMITDHDAYIAAAPEAFRPSLERLRSILARTLPDAEEMVAYNMPGFAIGSTVVASYAAFSRQCGLYVLASAIADHAEGIAAAGLKATKTGVTFTPRRPIPEDLVERLARSSRQDAGA